jgi:hypothetical protein
LISLHNYFIMHGIKYFFLNKNNQTIQGGGKKKFQGGKLPKTLPKSTIFQNPGGHVPPLDNPGSATDTDTIGVNYQNKFNNPKHDNI